MAAPTSAASRLSRPGRRCQRGRPRRCGSHGRQGAVYHRQKL